MNGKRRLWFGAAALAVVVAGGITVGVVTHYEDGARPGAAVSIESYSIDNARKAVVQLPIGALTVQVGKPAQDSGGYSDKIKAADGAVVVPVGWQLAGGSAGPGPTYQFQVTLVADGWRYDLQAGHEDDPASANSPPLVAADAVGAVVQGDGSNLRIEVEYDGLTQTLDVDSGKVDAGLAAPLYATSGLPSLRLSSGCSLLSPADDRAFRANGECDLGPVRLTPYVGGLGWVGSKTESWAVVPYTLRMSDLRSKQVVAEYDPSLRTLDITLDGARPTADLLRYRSRLDVSVTGEKVFRTSSTPRSLALTTELLGDAYQGADRVFRTAQTFTLT